ncbi:MAG: hypothetical protein ACXW5U_11480 [Thermoanaerobaculia bacterium]
MLDIKTAILEALQQRNTSGTRLMATPFLEWITRMNGRSPARVALANLLHDALGHRVGKRILKRLRVFIAREWRRHPDKSPDEMIRLFADTNPDQLYCQGAPPPVRTPLLGCSRVIDAKTLWQFNLDLPMAGLIVDNDIDTEEIRRVEKFGLNKIAVNEMRSRAPFAWVTKTDKFDALRKQVSVAAFANTVRDHLGLVSYLQRQKLVEVRYPPKTVESMTMAPPTVIEGGPGGPFRSVLRKDGWGRTRHLKTRKPAMPEAVHRPVGFTGDFTIRYVGQPDPVEASFKCKRCSEAQIEALLQMLGEQDENE